MSRISLRNIAAIIFACLVFWILAIAACSKAFAAQPTLFECAPGDTTFCFAEQAGPLTLPERITETPIILYWSMDGCPRAIVTTDRPMMTVVADGDSTIEVPSGQYYIQPIDCAVIALLTVAGEPTARLTWMNGFQEEYPLSKVRLYVVGRAR